MGCPCFRAQYPARAVSAFGRIPDGRLDVPVRGLGSVRPTLRRHLGQGLEKLGGGVERHDSGAGSRHRGTRVSLIRDTGFDSDLPTGYVPENVCSACYSLMADARIVAILDQLARKPEFLEEVAYARVHYLQETSMAERMGLATPA